MAVIKDFITRSGVIVQGTAAVSSSTGQTGALQVNSGAAIAKNLIVGTSAQVYGAVNLYDTLTVSGAGQIGGAFTASSTANLQGNVTVGGTLNVTGNSTLNSLTVTNASVFNGTILANNTSTFNAPVVISGTNTLSVGTGQATFGGIVSLTSNQAATTGGNGALRITGGAYVGNNIVVANTSASTATASTNALYVAGGTWVDKSLTVGGVALFQDNVIFSGTATYVYSTNTVYTDNLLNLHVPPGSTGTSHSWTLDDGKDIGFMFHYFETTDKDAFLGFNNSSGFLEFYAESTETGTGVVTPTVYGTFRTGGIRLVDTTTATTTTTGALQIVGGAGIGGNIYVGTSVSAGSIFDRELTQGRIVYVGAGGRLIDSGSLTFDGTTLTATVTTATNATNLLGGAVGGLPFQTATNQTVFLPIGNSGELLTVSGGKPAWISPSGLSAGTTNTATNIANGTAGQVPYQTAPGNTSFFGPGTAGQLLQSNGTSGPLYVNTGNVFVGYAVYGTNISGGAAGMIPIQSGANATAFIPVGAANTFLRHDGTTATFVTTGSMFVGNAVTATNLRAGTTGQVPYQSAAGTTSFTGPGTAGEILTSGGAGQPVYQNTLTLAGTTQATSTNTGALQVFGGVGVGGNIFVGGGTSIAGISTVTNTTNASSTTTGALQVVGGAGIGRDLYVGGTIYGVVTTATLISTAQRLSTATHFLTFVDSNNASATGENLYTTSSITINPATGEIDILSTLNSTSTTTGALVVTGGAGIGGNLFVGGGTSIAGVSTVTNTTNASSTTTGALQVVGGAGVGGSLFVGGNLNVTGTISGTLAGNATVVSVIATPTNATHFLTFVDSNNASPTGENVYTTSSFSINPSTGNITMAGALTIGSAVAGTTVNALYSNNVLLSSYTTPALVSTSTVTLDSLSTSSYRTARYTVQVVRGTNVHVTEAVVFHDGSNAYLNEYGIATTSGELGVFDASISTGNMLFTFAPSTTASTVVKVVRMALTS